MVEEEYRINRDGVNTAARVKGLVKRCHTHVGAPDNRIKALYKEHVLTPRGRDMNPELGPVVTASPKESYHIFTPAATGFL